MKFLGTLGFEGSWEVGIRGVVGVLGGGVGSFWGW